MATSRRERSPYMPRASHDSRATHEILSDTASILVATRMILKSVQGSLADVGDWISDENVDMDEFLPMLRRRIRDMSNTMRVAMTQLGDAEIRIQRATRSASAPASEGTVAP